MDHRIEATSSRFSFPWRYVVPRKGYFSLLKTARTHPQVRREVDRQAFMLPFFAAAAFALLAAYALRGAFGDRSGRKAG